MFRAISFILILLLSTSVLGREKARAISGAGSRSCATWTEAQVDPSDQLAAREWVLGFISGFNWASDSQAVPVDNNALFALVNNYCLAHPEQPLVYATSAAV